MFKMALNVKADVYHIHDPELLVTLLLLKTFTKSKVIYDIHEDVVSDIQSKNYLSKFSKKITTTIFSIIEIFTIKRADCNITATPYIHAKFIQINPQTLDINNYPIIDEFAGDYNPKKNAICYIGSITKVRGLTNIIKSLEGLNVELHLAGEYEPLNYRKELMEIKGWDNVIEHGFINRNKMKEILSFSNAGLVLFYPEPNHINAQPNKLFEYMSASVPVICSDFPLWRDIVEKNRCGILVDPSNQKEIIKAIKYILRHKQDAEQMGKNGRRAVEKIYNWKNEEKKLFDIYEKILKKD